ncbi:uncharacterized protein LOC101763529 [Setaria italica]|uniref:uncharacterized protein LOC101763529 n=1 Tax=Setaria italica TaxID=4555 RepID=UPI00035101BA|nr:uncharacterized protein LOC101763529 [Setaria italica]
MAKAASGRKPVLDGVFVSDQFRPSIRYQEPGRVSDAPPAPDSSPDPGEVDNAPPVLSSSADPDKVGDAPPALDLEADPSDPEWGLCGSSRDVQRRIDPFHALGTGLAETRVEAAPDAPDTAVPDAAVEAGTAAPDATGLIDGPGACAPALIEVAAAVLDADARPDPSAAATVSVTATGAGVPVTAVSFVTATEPTSYPNIAIFVAAPWADVPASAVVAAFVATAVVGVLASPAAAITAVAAGSDSLSSVATAIPVTAAGATASVCATVVGAARSSSTSSSRSITTLVGGPPGAMPCPARSTEEAEGKTGVRPCPVPGCGTTPPVAAAGATSTVGSAVSPATPPLAASGVTVRPAEVEDTRSAFFGASDGTKSRGAAL